MTVRRTVGGALIVVPSLLSGAGVAFILAAVLVSNTLIRDICIIIGAIMLWFDFFVTMAIIRYSLRSLDRRISVLESRGEDDPGSSG
jgi:NADH:ubiquinone oxidoreductase subunit 6 (subunit J)